MQNCKVSIAVPKTYTKDLAKAWSIVSGVRVYADESATEFVNLYESASKTLTISKAAIKNKPVAASTYTNVEIGGVEAASEKGVADATALAALSVSQADQSIKAEYRPIKEMDIADQVSFTLSVTGDTGLVKDGDVIFQYMQFKHKSEATNWNTVACATTVGSPSVNAITSFYGSV